MTQRRIYQCDLPYHITFNILNREWFFDDETKAKILHEIILNAGDIKNHTIYQFCIMPDPAKGGQACAFVMRIKWRKHRGHGGAAVFF